MIAFALAEPNSLRAAVDLLDPDDPTVRPIAGGTALMLMMKAGVFRPQKLVSLRKIEPAYSDIVSSAAGLQIGAMATLRQLESSADVRRHAPLVSQTLMTLSNARVRNVATIGGALAHGDPHMDLPPVLIALNAQLTIVSPAGERRLAVEDLISGYYETVLAKNELIATVHIPSQGAKRGHYSKVTTGSADDWPALGIAVLLDGVGDELRSVRIAVGAATDKATRLKSAEAVLNGKIAGESLLADAAEAGLRDCELIADVRGSIPYKRELMRVYLRRTIRAALRQPAGH